MSWGELWYLHFFWTRPYDLYALLESNIAIWKIITSNRLYTGHIPWICEIYQGICLSLAKVPDSLSPSDVNNPSREKGRCSGDDHPNHDEFA